MDSTNYASIIDNGFYTLAGSKYILVEFNEIIHNNTKLLSELLNEGVHFQVNASSVINNKKKTRNKFTHYLFKNRLVSFVASDVHNTISRKFHLDEAYKTVTKIYGIKYADKIFKYNQLNIINNFHFDSPKFLLKKSILSKFFGKYFIEFLCSSWYN